MPPAPTMPSTEAERTFDSKRYMRIGDPQRQYLRNDAVEDLLYRIRPGRAHALHGTRIDRLTASAKSFASTPVVWHPERMTPAKGPENPRRR